MAECLEERIAQWIYLREQSVMVPRGPESGWPPCAAELSLLGKVGVIVSASFPPPSETIQVTQAGSAQGYHTPGTIKFPSLRFNVAETATGVFRNALRENLKKIGPSSATRGR